MKFRHLFRPALAASVLVAGLATAAPQDSPALAALSSIEPGQWQLREIDGPESKSVCIADPRNLIQLHHQGAKCSRMVVSNDPRTAVVHYTCPGVGNGRTSITVETGRLFQLETQGMDGGAPFDNSYEARRTGTCRR